MVRLDYWKEKIDPQRQKLTKNNEELQDKTATEESIEQSDKDMITVTEKVVEVIREEEDNAAGL